MWLSSSFNQCPLETHTHTDRDEAQPQPRQLVSTPFCQATSVGRILDQLEQLRSRSKRAEKRAKNQVPDDAQFAKVALARMHRWGNHRPGADLGRLQKLDVTLCFCLLRQTGMRACNNKNGTCDIAACIAETPWTPWECATPRRRRCL